MPTKKKKTRRGGYGLPNLKPYWHPIVNTFNPYLILENFFFICENGVCRKLTFSETNEVYNIMKTVTELLEKNGTYVKIPDEIFLNKNTVYLCLFNEHRITKYFYIDGGLNASHYIEHNKNVPIKPYPNLSDEQIKAQGTCRFNTGIQKTHTICEPTSYYFYKLNETSYTE